MTATRILLLFRNTWILGIWWFVSYINSPVKKAAPILEINEKTL